MSSLSAWKRLRSGIQGQSFVFPGSFHLRATMLQHNLGILCGEFLAGDVLAVCGKQADHVRKLMQKCKHLSAKRASNVQIEMQQLGCAEPSRPSILRDSAHARSELKESSLAIDRDRGTSARILDGTSHIGLLIEPLPGRVLYFQGVLGTAFVDRVAQ